MKKILLSTLIVLPSMVLIGCTNSSSSTETTASTGIAYYIDSAVEGITVQCGSTVSTTDSLGSFTYEAGEVCSFSLGGILLREESDISEGEKVFEDSINVAQLLQSLDTDNDPSNGITITPEVLEILANDGVVTLPQSDEELENLVQRLQEEGILFEGEYVSEEEAQDHLDETKRELDAEDDHSDDGTENDDHEEDDDNHDDGTDDDDSGDDDDNDDDNDDDDEEDD